jgi:hypothetical protein
MDNYDNENDVVDVVEEETETDTEEAVTETETDSQEDEQEGVEKIDWEARAKKAEAAIIKAKAKPAKAPTEPKLTTFDLLALQKANIETEEDLDEVVRWADYNKISVAEALKSKILNTVLSDKAEERKSAAAVNLGTGRRAGGGQVSDERLLADAAKGIMPDEKDIARLAVLRMKNR